ncbi:hypothetical protein B0H11DRAFT_2243071 [Mycena galericulata]|nr:hypothetical protein B0H11DRAFT_2243071 [Mycena galericulata]
MTRSRQETPQLRIRTSRLESNDVDSMPDLISVAGSNDDNRPPWCCHQPSPETAHLASPAADLQRGESFAFFDGVNFGGGRDASRILVLSYDVSCQFKLAVAKSILSAKL